MKTSIYLLMSLIVLLGLTTACGDNSSETTVPEGQEVELPELKEGQDKLLVYQMLIRLFGNQETANVTYGTLESNGVGKFNDVSDAALEELRKFGITHIWYTGVLEHATMTDRSAEGIPADDADVVKGRAGSPYAIKDYYDVAPDLAEDIPNRMAEWEALIERTHQHGLKVLMDFVPNHVARQYHSDAKPEGVQDLGEGDDTSQGFLVSNNFYYLPGKSFQIPDEHNPLGDSSVANEDKRYEETPAKVTGNNVFSEKPGVNDWFETVKLNYGVDFQDEEKSYFDPVPPTWEKMTDILLFWAGKGVDGFRCDVAEMVPVEFWAYAIPKVKSQFPKITFIAEVYNPKRYEEYVLEGKFDYLYDKVGVYDTLRELMSGEGSTRKIANALDQSRNISKHMLRFLENHDEQRIASEQFSGDAWTGVPGMTVTALLGEGPVMLYFGQSVGEPGDGIEGFQKDDGRTTIFDYWGVPEHQKWMNGGAFDGGGLSPEQKELHAFYKSLNYVCRFHEAAQEGKFEELPIENEKVYAFLRYTDQNRLLIVANFDRNPQSYELGPEFLSTLGLAQDAVYSMEELLFEDNGVMELDGREAFADGKRLPVKVDGMRAKVFSIEPK